MKSTARPITWLVVSTGLLLMTVTSASAYIDPGTGSYLIQVLVAGLLGVTFVIKGFWKNIKGFVTRNRKQ